MKHTKKRIGCWEVERDGSQLHLRLFGFCSYRAKVFLEPTVRRWDWSLNMGEGVPHKSSAYYHRTALEACSHLFRFINNTDDYDLIELYP